jgi:hypothetical protein
MLWKSEDMKSGYPENWDSTFLQIGANDLPVSQKCVCLQVAWKLRPVLALRMWRLPAERSVSLIWTAAIWLPVMLMVKYQLLSVNRSQEPTLWVSDCHYEALLMTLILGFRFSYVLCSFLIQFDVMIEMIRLSKPLWMIWCKFWSAITCLG